MSQKNSRKQIEKKRARQRTVKKLLREKRLEDRKQKRLEFEREIAFEREFNEKQKLGLSNQEVMERLENNMKVLEALENQLETEEAARGETNKSKQAQLQMEVLEEFGTLQKELIELNTGRKKMEEEGNLSEEDKQKYEAKVQEIKEKISALNEKQKDAALPI